MKLFRFQPSFACGLTLTLALTATASAQTTWYVDDDGPGDPFPGVSVFGNPTFSDPAENGSTAHPYDDLYKAINAAVSGDEVVVLPSNVVGAYFLSSTLDFQGKAITVRSQGGAAVTVLDGTSNAAMVGVSFDDGEPAGTLFEGFTLRNFDNGSASSEVGGAMEIRNSSPTIRNCWFENNHAYSGGGLYVLNSNSLIEDCQFVLNDAVHQGGGAYTSSGRPVFSRCEFDGNTANYGGAFLSRTASGTKVFVQDCLFRNNSSNVGYAGGLAKFDSGDIDVVRSTFLGNVATMEGGGVHLSGGTNLVADCVFNANTSLDNRGGGVNVSTTGVHNVRGSTFHGNMGGGISENGSANLTVRNSIVWSNTPYEVDSSVSVSYCNVLGGYAGPNLDVDPLFADSDGQDNIPGTSDDDLSLYYLSPCIDAGDTTALPAGYPVDRKGNPRAVDILENADTGIAQVGQTTDIGAYEFQAPGRVQRVRR